MREFYSQKTLYIFPGLALLPIFRAMRCSMVFRVCKIVHFTVTGGKEAGVDLVLIQPFLRYYVNHVVLMLTSIF